MCVHRLADANAHNAVPGERPAARLLLPGGDGRRHQQHALPAAPATREDNLLQILQGVRAYGVLTLMVTLITGEPAPRMPLLGQRRQVQLREMRRADMQQRSANQFAILALTLRRTRFRRG